MLVRLLYASRASQTIDGEMVREIVHRSEANNLEKGITGILCTYPEGGIFLQVLEGARSEVNALYNKILVDTRHQDVTLLRYEEIEERHFAGWRMGSVDMKRVNLSTILRFSEKAALDPFSMTGASAKALLEELASTAAIVSRDLG
jgi:hypothetical protein